MERTDSTWQVGLLSHLIVPCVKKPLVQEQADAVLNRQRVAQGYCNSFYASQEHMREGWAHGEMPPASLVLGELHTIHSHAITQDRARVSDNQ